MRERKKEKNHKVKRKRKESQREKEKELPALYAMGVSFPAPVLPPFSAQQ